MKNTLKKLHFVIFLSFVFSGYSIAQNAQLSKGPINFGRVQAEVWGSYEMTPMLFPRGIWKFCVIVVPRTVRQGDLIEISKQLYSEHPGMRVRFFSDKENIQQYVDRDIYVNDSTGTAREVAFPDSTWVRNHLLGNINNRSQQHSRQWMLENRYGSMIQLLF